MSTRSARPVDTVSSAPEAVMEARATPAEAADAAAWERLAALKAADMPWLNAEGRAALSDAPEVSGAPTYTKPAG